MTVVTKRHASFRLLVVDDNENNLYTLRALIEKHIDIDVEILEALSGPEALKVALDARPIDLIILDVHMPDMDGFQTASMLKVRRRTADIPIIFLTAAYKTEEFQRKGYAIGAVDYLLKPIDDNLLINKISTYFRLIERERALNRTLEQKIAARTADLNRANRYLENIINTMGEALLVLDPEGIIKSANPAAYRMLGYPDGALTGMSIGDVFEEAEPEQAGAFMGIWLEALIRTGVISNIEARFIAKDNRRLPILFSRSAMQGRNGEITDIICIARDMTGYVRVDEDVEMVSSS